MRLCCVCSAQKHGLLRDASVPQKGNIETLLKKYALCGNENTQVMPCTHVVVMNKVFRCSANLQRWLLPRRARKILNSFHQKMLPYFSIYNKDARPMSQVQAPLTCLSAPAMAQPTF
jgi:hypothetical protein